VLLPPPFLPSLSLSLPCGLCEFGATAGHRRPTDQGAKKGDRDRDGAQMDGSAAPVRALRCSRCWWVCLAFSARPPAKGRQGWSNEQQTKEALDEGCVVDDALSCDP
jgi:hypothetical protein